MRRKLVSVYDVDRFEEERRDRYTNSDYALGERPLLPRAHNQDETGIPRLSQRQAHESHALRTEARIAVLEERHAMEREAMIEEFAMEREAMIEEFAAAAAAAEERFDEIQAQLDECVESLIQARGVIEKQEDERLQQEDVLEGEREARHALQERVLRLLARLREE